MEIGTIERCQEEHGEQTLDEHFWQNTQFVQQVGRRQIYHYTHRRAGYKLFGCDWDERVRQYDAACTETFKDIPELIIFSASHFGRVYGCSHVTAKKRLMADDSVIQVSAKAFVKPNSKFLREVVAHYHLAEFKKERLTLPYLLRCLQKIRGAESARYSHLKQLITQPSLSALITMGVLAKLRLDFVFKRYSLIYFNKRLI